MTATLYVVPGSNASMTGRLMADYKGIEYDRKDLVPGVHVAFLKARGFPGITVPALELDGRRVQGTLAIARILDGLQPDPPLLPADPERRRSVEEAEALGEGPLQHAGRRLLYCAGRRDSRNFASVVLDGESGLGPFARRLVRVGARGIVWAATQGHGATDEACRGALAELPGILDRVDGWIAEGVLNGAELTAADFQVGTNVRLLMLFDDLAPFLEARPVANLATRVAPSYVGRIGACFPREWLEPLAAAGERP